MVRRAHAERVPAVRFVAGGLGCDGHVDVVVSCSEAAAVLVLFDAGDIDEKRESPRRRRAATSGAACRPAANDAVSIGAQLAYDVDVRLQAPVRQDVLVPGHGTRWPGVALTGPL